MKTFKEFMEEFRYLPKAKMDRKIKDRESSNQGQTEKTNKIRLVRNILGKNVNLTKSDNVRNAENNKKQFNNRLQDPNLTPQKASVSINAAKKQQDIIKTRGLSSNKKNPTVYDKEKREYELLKQAVKNRSETDTKRIINGRKNLEKSYQMGTYEEYSYANEDQEALDLINETQRQAEEFIKNNFPK